MNTCIKYHSYLKEGYGANMDDEDWNTDLPLCSSTEMNQLFHSDIPVKAQKSLLLRSVLCSAPKGPNSNKVKWISLFAQEATEEIVRVSNNYWQKKIWLNLSESQIIIGKNSGMASFLLGTLY